MLTLITQFGGGKTHTLTALYHLAKNGDAAGRHNGVEELLRDAGISSLPRAKVAVFVGNAWDPQPGRETPWMDIAAQRAGDKGVEALGPAALTTPPGTDSIARVFQAANAPVLLLCNSLGTNMHMWDEQAAEWGKHFRLVRYDRRGHGWEEGAVCQGHAGHVGQPGEQEPGDAGEDRRDDVERHEPVEGQEEQQRNPLQERAEEQRAEAADAIAGKEKSKPCAACHGPDGNSPSAEFPKLAGQHYDYLVKALNDYKAGTRKNAIMAPQAANLSVRDIADLAAFYSQQQGLKFKY